MIPFIVVLFGVVPLSLAFAYLWLWGLRFSRELSTRFWQHWRDDGAAGAVVWVFRESVPEVLTALMLRFQGFPEEFQDGEGDEDA